MGNFRQHLARESQANKPCQLSAVIAKRFSLPRHEGTWSVLLAGWIWTTNTAKISHGDSSTMQDQPSPVPATTIRGPVTTIYTEASHRVLFSSQARARDWL